MGAGGEWEISPQVCFEPKIAQKVKKSKKGPVLAQTYISGLRGHQFAAFD